MGVGFRSQVRRSPGVHRTSGLLIHVGPGTVRQQLRCHNGRPVDQSDAGRASGPGSPPSRWGHFTLDSAQRPFLLNTRYVVA